MNSYDRLDMLHRMASKTKNPFKTNEVVVCTDSNDSDPKLHTGQEYIVTDTSGVYIFINFEGEHIPYIWSRFVSQTEFNKEHSEDVHLKIKSIIEILGQHTEMFEKLTHEFEEVVDRLKEQDRAIQHLNDLL